MCAHHLLMLTRGVTRVQELIPEWGRSVKVFIFAWNLKIGVCVVVRMNVKFRKLGAAILTAIFTISVVGSSQVFSQQSTTSEIALFEGWNLIGLPLVPEDPSIEVVLSEILDHVESVWAFDGEIDTWSSYSPGAPSDLTEMVDGKGYWIKMKADSMLVVHACAADISLIDVSFSRTEDTSSLLQYWIGKANETIRLMVMCITQDALAEALVDAHNRGIDIDIYIDNLYVSSPGSDFSYLQGAGIDIRSDDRGAFMHHKVMIIDDHIVVTGSYNWSASAEDRNDENTIILDSTSLAEIYMEEFNRLWT